LEETAAYVRLSVPSVRDTEDAAARLAAAKHLLEGSLRRPIIIQSAKAAASRASIRGPRLVYPPVLILERGASSQAMGILREG
jgi:hypothetical protein